MQPRATISIRLLHPGDAVLLQEMMAMFSTAFDDADSYSSEPPGAAYHESLLSNAAFIAIVAMSGREIVGGLTAYEIPKPERVSKEFFLYDLAVSAAYRRQGVASALIRALQALAALRGAAVVFVQAHREDNDAVALYSKHGSSADVLHFDFPPCP